MTIKPCFRPSAAIIFVGLILALFIVMMGVGGVAHAVGTTYYVDAEGGSDPNSGTSEASPLATLDRVNVLDLKPGDRVLFRGGQTFTGHLQLDAEDAGTPDNPVVVGSYGGGRAHISAGAGKGVSIHNTGGIEVSDLTIAGAGYDAGNRASGIEIYTDRGNAAKLEHVWLDNVEVSSFGDAGVILGAEPADGTKSGFKDVRITNVSAHDNADAGIETYGYFSLASGWAHEDFYVADCYAYNNKGIPDRSWHTGNGVVLSDVDGATIERCVAYNNGENNHLPTGGPVGIWVWDSNDVTIQHNESYSNKTASIDGGGFDLDGGVTNSVVQYNYSHDNAGAGYLLYQFPTARPFEDNVVRYNISENDGQTNRGGLHATGVTQTEVHDNTFYVGPRADGSLPFAVELYDTFDFRFRDNLLVSTGELSVDIPSGQDGLVIQGNECRYSGSILANAWYVYRQLIGGLANALPPLKLLAGQQYCLPNNQLFWLQLR